MAILLRWKIHRMWLYLLCSLVPHVVSAEVEFVPAIQVSHYWTDNRSLAIDELREEDTITEIQPELTLTMTSRRHRGVLDASYQHFTYHRANETRSFQQYSASTNSVLASDLLFLDLSADKFQSAISQQEGVAANNFSLTSNRTDVRTYGVRPYLLKQWNPRWRSRVDYDYQDIRSESTGLDDSQTQEITALMGYGGSGDIIRMDLSYNGVRTESDRVAISAEFDEIRLDSRYQMNKTWAWLLNVGYEEDRYDRSTIDKTEGGFGEIGAEVIPTPKITLSGTVGERYFGDTASLRLLYRYNSQTRIEAGYRKDITQSAIEINRSGTLTGTISQFDNLGNTFLVTEVFKTRRSYAQMNYQWAKSRGEISGYHEVRDFQLSLNQEIVDYVEATWAWSITAKSTLDLELSVRDREVDNQVGDDRLHYALVKIETKPAKYVSMGGEYAVTSRSGNAVQDYRQQQFGLFARVLF